MSEKNIYVLSVIPVKYCKFLIRTSREIIFPSFSGSGIVETKALRNWKIFLKALSNRNYGN